MASCTQIEQLHQAFLDDELSDAQRVILEEHVAGCTRCRGLLRAQQRANAELFEGFAEFRLTRDLTQRVMEHLPEMDVVMFRKDLQETNWRAKHPDGIRERLRRVIPLAAAILLVILGAVIRDKWPAPAMPANAVGVVTFDEGSTARVSNGNGEFRSARVKDYITKDARYQTGESSRLMLTLAGPTQVKLNRGTTVEVHDERKVTVHGGQAYFDVARSGDVFRVFTPNGDVSVYGTSFDVQVTAVSTRVILAEGRVSVRNDEFDSDFVKLEAGNQVEIVRGKKDLKQTPARVTELTAWATDMQPDDTARKLFLAKIHPFYVTEEIRLGSDFIVTERVQGKHLEALRFTWVPNPQVISYCGFDVLVLGENNKPIFRTSLKPEMFLDSRYNTIEIRNHTGITPDVSVIRVEIKPDCGRGAVAPELEVTAILRQKGNPK